jgi:nicotinamidase-related amidase
LVLIDVQRDFLDLPDGDAAMPVAGTRAAIPAMAKLAMAFRERGLPIGMSSGCTGRMVRTPTRCGGGR